MHEIALLVSSAVSALHRPQRQEGTWGRCGGGIGAANGTLAKFVGGRCVSAQPATAAPLVPTTPVQYGLPSRSEEVEVWLVISAQR